jgi:hypothetical protein
MKHTLEGCIASASKYSTRKDWMDGDGDAYFAAYKNNWSSKCCAHMTAGKQYSLEKCKKSAAKYSTRKEWEEKESKFYYAAKRNNWHEDCCRHMVSGKIKHTLETCLLSASKHLLRAQWKLADEKSYQAAMKNGWMVECCKHMSAKPSKQSALDDRKTQVSKYPIRRRPRISNCLYIWRVVGVMFNGEPVFKIGVTNSSTKESRIRLVARRAGFTPEIVLLRNIGVNAKPLEAKLLALGLNPEYTGFDGCTEFRALNPSAFDAVLTLITAATESALR